MKKVFVFVLSSLLIFSCSDGESDLVVPNETSSQITSAINGSLKCVNGNPIASVAVTFIDEAGNVSETTTDDQGNFSVSSLESGTYAIQFDNSQLYDYSFDEYQELITDLRKIILGEREHTTADQIAYHLINLEDGLTTFDQVLFERLRDGKDQLEDAYPWRYITQEELDQDVVTISNVVHITIEDNQTSSIDIIGFFVGDPTGSTCN